MPIIKLTTPFPEWPLVQQTPGKSGRWGKFEFAVNRDVEACDCWVVYEGLLAEETTVCSPDRTLLITAEPPNIKHYAKGFLDQFAFVRTAHSYISHPGRIIGPPALPWHVGRVAEGHRNLAFRLGYTELAAIRDFPKTRLLSVISSAKTMTPQHRRRLEIVEALKVEFSDQIDVFGRGIRDIPDKWDAIAPYKYHVVIENGWFDDYWTEKLTDCYLASAFPLYVGCPNLSKYFPRAAFVQLPHDDTRRCVELIRGAIDADIYGHARTALRLARIACLDIHNLFPVVANWCGSQLSRKAPRPITLRPEHAPASR